jgi:hypothetical protein
MNERPIYQSFSSRLQEARLCVARNSCPSKFKGTAIYRLAEALERIDARLNDLRQARKSQGV